MVEIIHFVKTWEDGGVESFLEIMRKKFGDKIFVKRDHDKVSYKDFKDKVIIFHTPAYFLKVLFFIINRNKIKIIFHNDLDKHYSIFKKLIIYPWLLFLRILNVKFISFIGQGNILNYICGKNLLFSKYFYKNNLNLSDIEILEGQKNIIFVGRYDERQKNFSLASSLLKYAASKGIKVKIYGNYPNKLKDEYSLHGFSFEGFKNQLSDIYKKNSILLVTSRYESGPLVVLEALSYGLPIMSTPVGLLKNIKKRKDFQALNLFETLEEGKMIINWFAEQRKFKTNENVSFLNKNTAGPEQLRELFNI